MRRCARPGCPVEAAWAVGFDPVARVAWLTGLDGAAPIVLCAAHAEALRLPRGWAGLDERGAESALWMAGETVTPRSSRPRRRRTERTPPANEVLPLYRLDNDPAGHIRDSLYGRGPSAGDGPGPGPVGAGATVPPPAQQADSPLLARAFRTAGLG